MFCPSCGAKHRDAIVLCPDCGVDLVPSLSADFADERVVVAWSGEDPVAFSVALAALKAADISAREISQYNRLVRQAAPRRPSYEIAVRPEDAARASEVIGRTFDTKVPE